MTLHPITVVENVIEERRRTECRARTENLRAVLEMGTSVSLHAVDGDHEGRTEVDDGAMR